jgi:hypothetical protein
MGASVNDTAYCFGPHDRPRVALRVNDQQRVIIDGGRMADPPDALMAILGARALASRRVVSHGDQAVVANALGHGRGDPGRLLRPVRDGRGEDGEIHHGS